jgi:hypothetical protein
MATLRKSLRAVQCDGQTDRQLHNSFCCPGVCLPFVQQELTLSAWYDRGINGQVMSVGGRLSVCGARVSFRVFPAVSADRFTADLCNHSAPFIKWDRLFVCTDVALRLCLRCVTLLALKCGPV